MYTYKTLQRRSNGYCSFMILNGLTWFVNYNTKPNNMEIHLKVGCFEIEQSIDE